jgi:pimeloyl-ACP methyl ester carboxylesterase
MPIAQLNGTTLCYEETGRGEPLVLVHGAWVDHTNWELVVPRLSTSFRVVTYDLRGHGESKLDPPEAGTVHDDIADLVALIEHLDLGPVNVAGISSGACIALRFASEQPALVRRVLPHEPPCFEYLADNAEAIPMLTEFGATLAHVQRQIEDGDHCGAAERFFETFYPWSDLSPAQQGQIASHARAFLGQLRDPDAIVLDPDAMRGVTAPVLLSEGDQSPPFAILVVEELATVLPNSKRHVFSNAGHVPHMTHPDEYVDLILEFVGNSGEAQ